MADLVRNAKSGSTWTEHELIAFNISIADQGQQTFFGGPLPEYTGSPGFAQYEELTDNLDRPSLSLIVRLLAAHREEDDDSEAAIQVDFTHEVLRAMGYERRDACVRRRKALRLDICGEETHTQADVCVLGAGNPNVDNILLVVQVDNSHIDPAANPEAQLVASAIAAFQMNNVNRCYRLFLPALESLVVPGITVSGTFPRFYKIHVTTALDLCIQGGLYPPVQATVHRHTPCVPGRSSEGMKPLDNRVHILECYEAFKKIVYPQ
ncbi:hypothetical protein BJ912DRAFT_997108 [Pholiota molesta]|nr:hypothetical protein BJ912DRAFT_997108 [Pholiota molesta]